MNEGIIKFQCNLIDSAPPEQTEVRNMNKIRNKLFELHLIGTDADGIGFGNLSIRYKNTNKFIITGTQTGRKDILDNSDYTLVSNFDIEKNKLECRGKIEASSESLTHAAVYIARKNVNAVIHIHNRRMWNSLINKTATTSPEHQYGTSGLARAVAELCGNSDKNLIVLGGHPDGILAFGKNLEEAYVTILSNFKKFKN